MTGAQAENLCKTRLHSMIEVSDRWPDWRYERDAENSIENGQETGVNNGAGIANKRYGLVGKDQTWASPDQAAKTRDNLRLA
ncbi:MAG: hypothetical protein AAFV69_07275 [Pseudomonadota bacterium]